jgi:hypothetical protein
LNVGQDTGRLKFDFETTIGLFFVVFS